MDQTDGPKHVLIIKVQKNERKKKINDGPVFALQLKADVRAQVQPCVGCMQVFASVVTVHVAITKQPPTIQPFYVKMTSMSGKQSSIQHGGGGGPLV